MLSAHVIAAIIWAVILGAGGGLLTDIGEWYHDLKKPTWQPPDWLFGPAWTLILGLTAWAGVIAWNTASGDAARVSIIIAYAVNFVCHFLWSPLFFKWKRPDWALIEVIFLWFSILALILVTSRQSSIAGLMIVPYISWVSFAALLNAKIVQLNKPFA